MNEKIGPFRVYADGRYIFSGPAALNALSTAPDGARLLPFAEGWLLQRSAQGPFLCRQWIAPGSSVDVWR